MMASLTEYAAAQFRVLSRFFTVWKCLLSRRPVWLRGNKKPPRGRMLFAGRAKHQKTCWFFDAKGKPLRAPEILWNFRAAH